MLDRTGDVARNRRAVLPIATGSVDEEAKPQAPPECHICAFPLPVEPLTEAAGPQCPVCLDGQADPWAIVREIRALFGTRMALPDNGLGDGGDDVPDVFETDAEIIGAAASAFWPKLAANGPIDPPSGRLEIECQLQRKCGYDPLEAIDKVSLLLAHHERFHGHWEIMAEAVERRWPGLPARSIKTMSGTVTELAGLIARQYGISRKQARSDIMALLEDLHFGTLLGLGEYAAPDLRSRARRISGSR